MKYGLIGSNVKFSYSKLIHSHLNSYEYELISLNEQELVNFLKNKDFFAVNITIPYKVVVMKYLDEIDDIAKEINAVNTIVNTNGHLKGYNTDYYGLKKIIEDNNIIIENKNCYILGNGGTKNTAYKVLKDLHAKSINVVSRTKSINTISYQEFNSRKDVDIIVNTTPVGSYPNIEDEIITLEDFPSLEGVIDVIYNPLQTRLITRAKELGIKTCGGLKMLVEQGIKASELFNQKNYSDSFDKIYSSLYFSKKNIVLIGMPMSGKSTIGKEVAKKLNKQFVDIDEEIEKEAKMTINEIFTKYGESYFRKLEKEITLKYAKENNLVISCGGGVILNKNNILNLKANGLIIYLTRDEKDLIFSTNRPLTKNIEEYLSLKKEREMLYNLYKDYEVKNSSVEECSNKIKEVFYESINY